MAKVEQNQWAKGGKRTQPLPPASNMLWNSVGSILYMGSQWLITVLVVVLSDSYENSGLLSFAMSTGVMFGSVALFKVRTFQISDVDNQFSQQNYIGFRLITISFAFVFCLLYLGLITDDVSYIVVSVVYLLFKGDEAFVDVLYGSQQRMGRMDYIGRSLIIRSVALLIGFLAPYALLDNLYISLATMALFCFSVTVVYDLVRTSWFGLLKPSITIEKGRAIFRYCVYGMVGCCFSTAMVSLPRQFFGIVYGSEMLGIYASIATIAVLVQVAVGYLYGPLIGEMAARYRRGKEEFNRYYFKLFFVIVALCVILTFLLSSIGGFVLVSVFGVGVEPYINTFPFVLLSAGAIGLLSFANDALMATRRMKSLIVVNIAALVIALACSGCLIPALGMNGVNFSVIAGAIVGVFLASFCVVRRIER